MYKMIDFNTPLSAAEGSHKTNKDIEDTNTMNQLDLANVYGTLHPTTTACTFFTSDV